MIRLQRDFPIVDVFGLLTLLPTRSRLHAFLVIEIVLFGVVSIVEVYETDPPSQDPRFCTLIHTLISRQLIDVQTRDIPSAAAKT